MFQKKKIEQSPQIIKNYVKVSFEEMYKLYVAGMTGDIEIIDDGFQRTWLNPIDGKSYSNPDLEITAGMLPEQIAILEGDMDRLLTNNGFNKLISWSNKLLANRGIKYSEDTKIEKNILLWLEFMTREVKRLSNNFRTKK